MSPPARQCFQTRSHPLSHGVDGVCTHRIATINQQMNDEHLAHRGWQPPNFNVFATAAEGDHPRRNVVAKGHELLFGVKDVRRCLFEVLHLQQLDLPDHDGFVAVGGETAVLQTALRHVGGCGHHAGLLEAKGNEVVRAVDHEIGGDANGQGHGADHVLNHPIGSGFVQLAVLGQCVDLRRCKVGRFSHQLAPLLDGEFVQAFHSTVLDRHGAPGGGWCVRSLNQSLLCRAQSLMTNAINA